ncbi:unnamed protein product [Eruca vesicaria subsp. sativa]|uniref:Transcription elongation factor Eaf N-terminal domain-containing protein n=1 Tax=Eruca vesicaria subsp. sativa TaxID=29727 RepID=A0ABC8J0X7_ERUVS|nr:unnamed protein product [Eruca vesicaria subsp. sativa]
MSNHSRDEPSTAPKTDQWYDLVLGSSAKDDSSHKFCTLRYEFKPASIDKKRSGTLHKKKDNRVSVEFQNNQIGKPKVTFEGSSEDYKDNDAVLFFDGEKFRLERLHRAVKQLRHVRTPGESAAASQSTVPPPVEHHRLSPPLGRAAKSPHVNRSLLPDMPVEVERIEIGKRENSAEPAIPANNTPSISPVDEKIEDGEEEHHEIDLVDIFGSFTPEKDNAEKENADVGGEYEENLNKQLSITEEEIADVDDDSGGEGEKGLNAAEALRAQVNAEVQKRSSSSSSSSSGSSSGSDSDGRSKSVSGSGQSSSGSSSRGSGSGGSDDEDEVNSV